LEARVQDSKFTGEMATHTLPSFKKLELCLLRIEILHIQKGLRFVYFMKKDTHPFFKKICERETICF
jgi:hypothetical protein